MKIQWTHDAVPDEQEDLMFWKVMRLPGRQWEYPEWIRIVRGTELGNDLSHYAMRSVEPIELPELPDYIRKMELMLEREMK